MKNAGRVRDPSTPTRTVVWILLIAVFLLPIACGAFSVDEIPHHQLFLQLAQADSGFTQHLQQVCNGDAWQRGEQ